MIIKYKIIWGNEHHGHVDHIESSKIEIETIIYCCDRMKQEYRDNYQDDRYIRFDNSRFNIGPYIFGWWVHDIYGDSYEGEITEFKFCPFCGEKVTIECVAEYKWKNVSTGNKVWKEKIEIIVPQQTRTARYEADETKPELVRVDG